MVGSTLPGGTGLPRVISKEEKRYRRQRSRERCGSGAGAKPAGQVGLRQVGEPGKGMAGGRVQMKAWGGKVAGMVGSSNSGG